MASDSPEPFHHHVKHARGGEYGDQPHPHRLPVIPDLRFEYSYLRSIRPYVSVERISSVVPEARSTMNIELAEEHGYVSLGPEGKERVFPEGDELTVFEPEPTTVAGPTEVIHVQWQKIAWVTIRDQVISPFLQGALWALASYYWSPFSTRLGSQMGTYFRGLLPSKEGAGITWIRGWSKKLGLADHATGIQRTPKLNT